MAGGTVLYIGGFEMPDKNAAAHRVLSNAKIFRELGYKVIFIDIDKNLKYDSNILNTKKKVQEFDCWSVPYPKSKSEWLDYLSNISRIMKICDMVLDLKIIICYNYQSVALKKLTSYCKKTNIKIIADVTEWYSARRKGVAFFLLKGLDTFYRMRILHKKMDGLIVISEYLEKYYKRMRNVINIPPLVDLNEEKWRMSPSNEGISLRFVYAGSPGKKDKINTLIYMFKKVKFDYLLSVIGISKEEYLNDYPEPENIVQNDKIQFLGRLSHIQTIEHVKKADFSLFFRENNRVTKAGFPTKFVEAVSCGTAIITNQTNDILKYKEKVNMHLLDCKNSEGIENIVKNNKLGFLNKKNNDIFHYKNYIKPFFDLCSDILED